MIYTARDLRNNSFILLRRVERQNEDNVENKLIKNNIGKMINSFLENKNSKYNKCEQKNKFKSNMFHEKTITKLGAFARKR